MSRPQVSAARRQFLQMAAANVSTALLLPRFAAAEDLPELTESATALGYKDDAAAVDAAKFPQHRPGQNCLNCNFFHGTATRGPCVLFPGKSVAGKGWCSAYEAKA